VRVPESWLPVLAILKAAGGLGLLVGIGVPIIGTAAASGLTLFLLLPSLLTFACATPLSVGRFYSFCWPWPHWCWDCLRAAVEKMAAEDTGHHELMLEGKIAVITGGTSGIGARTAEIFAAEGGKLVIMSRFATRRKYDAKS
jgi:DoxX-like protein